MGLCLRMLHYDLKLKMIIKSYYVQGHCSKHNNQLKFSTFLMKYTIFFSKVQSPPPLLLLGCFLFHGGNYETWQKKKVHPKPITISVEKKLGLII